jgi:hypothetical protein
MFDVVGRKAVEFLGIGHFDLALISKYCGRNLLLLGQFVVELFELGARGLVFVDAGQAKLKQVSLHIVAGSRIRFRNVQGGERLVDVVIQAEGGLAALAFWTICSRDRETPFPGAPGT